MQRTLKSTLVGFSLLVSGLALAGDASIQCPEGTRKIGGPRSAIEATTCVNAAGLYHGPYVEFDKAQNVVVRGTWKDGFRHGKFTFFDANGVKTGETHFARDNYDGKRIKYFANGQPRTVENYVKGNREGVQQEFDLRGNLVSSTEFRNDRQVAAAK